MRKIFNNSFKCILVTRALDRPKALGNSMQENMRRRVLIAKNWLNIGTLRCLLTPRTNMNAPIRDAFDCSSRKPMRRHFVSGFPKALLSLSQEKSSGVEIFFNVNKYPRSHLTLSLCQGMWTVDFGLLN